MPQENRANYEAIMIDFFKIFKGITRKLWVIILVCALCGSAMFAYRKSTYVPQYRATVTMYSCPKNPNTVFDPSVSNFTDTCIAVLNTRMTLEEVAAASGLDMTYSKLSGMISAAGISSSPLFTITVSGQNPEEITLIANTAADILPDNVHSIYNACEVGVVDYALVPSAPYTSSNTIGYAAAAAALGAMMVCVLIAAKVVYTDNITSRKKNISR